MGDAGGHSIPDVERVSLARLKALALEARERRFESCTRYLVCGVHQVLGMQVLGAEGFDSLPRPLAIGLQTDREGSLGPLKCCQERKWWESEVMDW